MPAFQRSELGVSIWFDGEEVGFFTARNCTLEYVDAQLADRPTNNVLLYFRDWLIKEAEPNVHPTGYSWWRMAAKDEVVDTDPTGVLS